MKRKRKGKATKRIMTQKGVFSIAKTQENLTQARFEIIVAMLNEDPDLHDRVKVYFSE